MFHVMLCRYSKLVSQSSCFLYDRQIRKDLPRTFPHHPVLMTIHGRAMLFNVLKAYSIYDADIGYSQGNREGRKEKRARRTGLTQPSECILLCGCFLCIWRG